MYKTTNGGTDWVSQGQIFNFHLLKIFFCDENNGYMISDNYFLKTTDGGSSWTSTHPTDHVLRGMFFLNKNTGWISGGEGIILKTTDAGLTWNYQQANNSKYSVLTSLYFNNESKGFATGSGLDIEGGVILKTSTSGNQWQLVHSGYNSFIYSISFCTTDSGWAVGNKGIMFNTTDGGYTWKLQGSRTLADLYSLKMKLNQIGWAVGDGIILKFRDDTTSTPLPVEISNFQADYYSDRVEINWKTITEFNNKGFEIERKISDKWESVGFVGGNGTTTGIHTYSFNDYLQNLSYNGNLIYRLKQIDYDGTFKFSNEITVNVKNLPVEYSLSQNYPNPFNPSTKIKYSLSENTHVILKIYDVLGKEIKTLIDEEKTAGNYSINFDAGNFSSGTYFYTINAGEFIQTKKMVLIK